MGLVQIEESELATLRRERDEAKRTGDELASQNRELTTKVERAEADKVKAEETASTEKKRADGLEEKAQAGQLRDKRMGALGTGFLAKLGETSKTRLGELAAKCSDEEWDVELKEREEIAQVKRDASTDPSAPTPPTGGSEPAGFKSEEVASFLNGGPARAPSGGSSQDGSTSVRQLARTFGGKRQTAAK